mgnify:CR=1 FL=1
MNKVSVAESLEMNKVSVADSLEMNNVIWPVCINPFVAIIQTFVLRSSVQCWTSLYWVYRRQRKPTAHICGNDRCRFINYRNIDQQRILVVQRSIVMCKYGLMYLLVWIFYYIWILFSLQFLLHLAWYICCILILYNVRLNVEYCKVTSCNNYVVMYQISAWMFIEWKKCHYQTQLQRKYW